MIRVRIRVALCALCLAAGVARAAVPPRVPGARSRAPAPASRAAAGSTRHPARTSAVTRARAAADTSARARPRAAPRTLDEIQIEGEIPVPQVLFVTAREQRRFMEFQHHRYLRSSLELGRATATPTRIVVTSPAPEARKENQR